MTAWFRGRVQRCPSPPPPLDLDDSDDDGCILMTPKFGRIVTQDWTIRGIRGEVLRMKRKISRIRIQFITVNGPLGRNVQCGNRFRWTRIGGLRIVIWDQPLPFGRFTGVLRIFSTVLLGKEKNRRQLEEDYRPVARAFTEMGRTN